ncbi:TonB-dependent receptor [Thalassotalea sp. PS06]|uniref:TonB-dependent receptor n=1 Tax=Thalassotalea sp. PS06 TaxID=2594005 RepID=UPI0011646A66|nr:TonB-dependent receptor [Thalassotalea sp. PS06]QDP02704.1 TonB-dependent receptor [Thalassotalea sp. PS06]
MLNFKPNKVALALVSTGLISMSSVSFAAEETAAEQEVEVIEVTGIRGSLQKAQAIKMSTNSIVEVLSAEDIGKLPDTSVAESLSRLPGLSGERRNGRTSGLSVRGFNENYVGTSLNGRELLGMGDNRGVEYDLYPTEIVSTIVVYKTPEAGLVSQGIGGTIDLQTVSPLNADSTFTINADYEQNGEDAANPDYDNNGHRFSFNWVDQFADDTLGLALTVATQETPRQEEQFRAWGYADSDDGKILGGHDSFVRSAMLERDSIAGIVEWAPTDNLKLQLDALYIDFNENDVRRGLEEGGPVWGGVNYTVTEVENGLVTSGYWDGFHSVIRNDARSQEAELTTFGLNVEYSLTDDWTLEADLSTGKVDKLLFDVESYSGVGRAGMADRPTAARSWEMTSTGVMYSDHPTLPGVDYTDESLIRLAGPQAWGAPIIGGDAQDGFVNRPEFEESLDSFRLSVNGVVEWGFISAVEAGIMYSDRSKSKLNEGDYLTAPSYPGDAPIPEVLGVADLSFIGINGVLAYDSLGLFKSGYYTATEASLVQNDRLGDTYEVDEEITTLYGKLDIDTEFAGIYVSGNFGVQVIDVDQSSTGFSTTTEEGTGNTLATAVSGGDSYTDVLPTLNLSFEIAENQFIRTAIGKVQSRPRMDQMKPNNQFGFSFNANQVGSEDPENGPWSGSAGNPTLKPLEANQFDISYENYFADEGYFAAAFFYKDLTNWHRSGSVLTDFSDEYIPGYHQVTVVDEVTGEETILTPQTFEGFVGTTTDGFEGFVRGYEFQASVPFNLFADALDGFGLVGSATFLDGELDDGGRIPGLSEESYSFTAYYENSGFEIRLSGTKRDEFLTEARGLSLSLQEFESLGGELWDAQIGYDFSESGIDSLDGLRVTFKVQNLTKEDDVQADAADSRFVTLYQYYGANYLLGINYEF